MVAKYPVDNGDDQGVIDAVNYLLSGPAGLGQNFAGFSSYATAYLTGNYRIPFTQPTLANLYVPDIALGVSEMLDGRTWKFWFATPQATAPFSPGNIITVFDVSDPTAGVSDLTVSGTKAALGTETTYSDLYPTNIVGSGADLKINVTLTATGSTPYDSSNTIIEIIDPGSGYVVGDTLSISGTLLGGTSPTNDLTLTVLHTIGYYDGNYQPIGVVECTIDYVIARTTDTYEIKPPGSGGYVYLNTSGYMSTDCNARVTVTGGSDRVFISAQLDNIISYIVTTGTDDLIYTVAVNRYAGYPNNNPINPDYIFDIQGTVAQKTYTYSALTGSGTLPLQETIFTTLLDQPGPGYYWYILEVEFTSTGGNANITSNEFGLRSLSAQVVKQ